MHKRLLAMILCTFFCSAIAEVQTATTPTNSDSKMKSEIKTLELKLSDLIVRADWDEYRKLLASDYIRTTENGQVENKEETLASLSDVKRKVIVMEMESNSIVVHTYGDSAVSSAEFTIRVRDSGQVKSRRIRQTDVFVKRDGEWLLVAGHGSVIGK